MNTVLWVVAAFLALAFAGAGVVKLTRSRTELAKAGPQMAWVEDFTDGQVRLIGALEVLGAIGLVLPPLVGVLPVLAPLAATGLVLLMLGAAITHARRREFLPNILVNVVLVALAAFVAWGRFGPQPF